MALAAAEGLCGIDKKAPAAGAAAPSASSSDAYAVAAESQPHVAAPGKLAQLPPAEPERPLAAKLLGDYLQMQGGGRAQKNRERLP